MRIKHVVMKKNLLLVYFILSALSLPAQHILVGDVLDSIDSLPVPCAGIIIYPQDTTIVADTMGHFCTTVCESDAVLVFKCVGYYDKKVHFTAERNNVTNIVIFLKPRKRVTDPSQTIISTHYSWDVKYD